MKQRIGPCENGGVGREGKRDRSVGLLNQNTIGCQAVDVRRSNRLVAITFEVVRPQRVDGEQDKVRRPGLRRFRLLPVGRDRRATD